MHDLADVRALGGIPHTLNVLTCVPLLIAAAFGFAHVLAERHGPVGYAEKPVDRALIGAFFLAAVVAAFGWSWYHVRPGPDRAFAEFWSTIVSVVLLAVMLRDSPRYSHQNLIRVGIGFLALGALCAGFDHALFELLAYSISGHSLMHLFVGVGVGLLARYAISRRPLRPPPPPSA